MPFQPNIPPTIDVDGPKVQKSLAVYHITSFTVVVNPNLPDATSVKVNWDRGSMNGGTFVTADSGSAVLTGQAVLNKINEVTTGGTVYNEVKQRLWELLVAAGKIPAGTIS